MGTSHQFIKEHTIGFKQQTLDTIADALERKGYVILSDALSKNLIRNLHKRVHTLTPEDWKTAGIGRNQKYQLDQRIRSDKIHWISNNNRVESVFLTWAEKLRLGLNQKLFQGLFNFEGHFSMYPQGAYYQKHIDALTGNNNRVLSLILYLNTNWDKADAGEFLLYHEAGNHPIQTIIPKLGTLVLFLSEQFPHEVLKAHRPRFSLAGWFRGNIDLYADNNGYR
jgi:SM-20-related protein